MLHLKAESGSTSRPNNKTNEQNMLVSTYIGNHHIFGELSNYAEIEILKKFSSTLSKMPFSSITMQRESIYILSFNNEKNENQLHEIKPNGKKILLLEKITFPIAFKKFVLLHNKQNDLIVIPFNQKKLYFLDLKTLKWRNIDFESLNFEFDTNFFYYQNQIVFFEKTKSFVIRLPLSETQKNEYKILKIPKRIGGTKENDDLKEKIQSCKRELLFSIPDSCFSKREMVLFDSLLFLFGRNDEKSEEIWMKKDIFLGTKENELTKEVIFTKKEITEFSRDVQVSFKEDLLNSIIKNEVKSFIKRGKVEDAMILEFLERIINDFPLFKNPKREKESGKEENIKKKKQGWFSRWIWGSGEEDVEEKKKKEVVQKSEEEVFFVFNKKNKVEEEKKLTKEEEEEEEEEEKIIEEEIVLKQYKKKEEKKEEADEVFFVFHKRKKKKKEPLPKKKKDISREDLFKTNFKDRESEFLDFILNDKEDKQEEEKNEIVVLEEVKHVKKKKGWLSMLGEKGGSIIPNLKEWWGKNDNKNASALKEGESPGKVIYFLAEFLEIFRRAFKSEEKEYNYLSYINGVINFFVKSTVDSFDFDKAVAEVTEVEVVKKLLDDNSTIVKKIESKIEKNKSLVSIVLNLDEPEKIYTTIKDTLTYEKLPPRYRDTFYQCSKELVSFLLTSYSEFETISSSRIKYVNVVKKVLWIIKPVFLYSNPLPVAHYLISFFLFSSIGKYFFDAALQIDELQKKINVVGREIRAQNQKLFDEINTYLVIENLKELRKIEELIMIDENTEEKDIKMKNSTEIFQKLFLNKYFKEFNISKEDLEVHIEYFKLKILLFEKQNFLLSLDDKETQGKIYSIVDLLLPILKIFWDTIEVEKFISKWIETISRLVDIAEENEKLKKQEKLGMEERKKIWNEKVEIIYNDFAQLVFNEISKCLRNDEKKEKIFERTVNWALQKKEIMENTYINMSKYYFTTKKKKLRKKMFITEVREIINAFVGTEKTQ